MFTFLLCCSLLGHAQSISINTPNGKKTLYADKSKACNKDLIFMVSAERPEFDKSHGELDDRLSTLINFDKSVTGPMIIWFVINCDGESYGFQLIKGINEEVNKKIVDGLTKLQGWKPGKQDGKPIDSIYNLSLEIKKGKIKNRTS